MATWSRRFMYFTLVMALYFSPSTPHAIAGTTAVLTDFAEQFLKKFGVGIGGKTAGEVAETLGRLSTRYGDDVLPFAKVAGHQGLHLLDSLGDAAAKSVLSIFERYGGKAGWLIEHEKELALALKYGDDATDVIIRYPGLASDVIAKFGEKGAMALNHLDTQDARWFTKLFVDEGGLSVGGGDDRLIGVVTKYGNAAMDFVWRNKAPLAGAATMTAFLDNPEPYINGTKELIVEPITSIAGETVHTIASDVSWNWLVLPFGLIIFLAFGGTTLFFRIRRQWVSARTHDSLNDVVPLRPPYKPIASGCEDR